MQENRLPHHLAVIMDGNGRWARQRKLPRSGGHIRGVEATRCLVRACVKKKIPILTVFAFSSENWKRPRKEVELLMKLLGNVLAWEVDELHQHQVKLRIVGDLSVLPRKLVDAIKSAQQKTQHNTGLLLNIAINYGGRWDILQATQNIAKAVANAQLTPADVDEDLFRHYLTLGDLPDPDLLIRTSGEQRISNYLLWNLAYSELYFTPTFWPDFDEASLDEALDFYAKRERRYGCATAQVEHQVPKLLDNELELA